LLFLLVGGSFNETIYLYVIDGVMMGTMCARLLGISGLIFSLNCLAAQRPDVAGPNNDNTVEQLIAPASNGESGLNRAIRLLLEHMAPGTYTGINSCMIIVTANPALPSYSVLIRNGGSDSIVEFKKGDRAVKVENSYGGNGANSHEFSTRYSADENELFKRVAIARTTYGFDVSIRKDYGGKNGKNGLVANCGIQVSPEKLDKLF
jgi:hypothetical protein